MSQSKMLMSQWTEMSISSADLESERYFSKYFILLISSYLSHLKSLFCFLFSSHTWMMIVVPHSCRPFDGVLMELVSCFLVTFKLGRIPRLTKVYAYYWSNYFPGSNLWVTLSTEWIYLGSVGYSTFKVCFPLFWVLLWSRLFKRVVLTPEFVGGSWPSLRSPSFCCLKSWKVLAPFGKEPIEPEWPCLV